MIVHFIASKSNPEKDYPAYKKIIELVKELGHEIARDWVSSDQEFISTGRKHNELDWQKLNEQNLAALSRSELIIAEATSPSFSVGFLVANAIQQKKPVLILTRNNALAGTFVSGIDSDFVRLVDYEEGDDAKLKKDIGEFIDENTIENKDLRFNFFIDRPIYNYLRWAAFKTGKTKAEILRELVLKEIEKRD